jgi:hypothetical protein
MSISPKGIIPLTKARAKLTELCEEVRREGGEKIVTKNGKLRRAHRRRAARRPSPF